MGVSSEPAGPDDEVMPRSIEAYVASRRWRRVGEITQYDELSKRYPHSDWDWAGTYNCLNPSPLIISDWNHGIRVMFRDLYPHGDDGSALHLGTALWTRGTQDPESKAEWHHRYVSPGADGSLRECCGSNGNGGLVIWVRRH
jgi:hypothetical protein